MNRPCAGSSATNGGGGDGSTSTGTNGNSPPPATTPSASVVGRVCMPTSMAPLGNPDGTPSSRPDRKDNRARARPSPVEPPRLEPHPRAPPLLLELPPRQLLLRAHAREALHLHLRLFLDLR